MTTEQPLFQPRFSTRSWHRKIYDYVWREEPYRISICVYFWSTVFATILLPFVAFGRFVNHRTSYHTKRVTKKVLRTIGKAVLIGYLAVAGGSLIITGFLYAWWLPFTMIGIGTLIVGCVWLTAEAVDKIRYSNLWYFRIRPRLRRKHRAPKVEPIKPPKPPKKPSMTMAYLIAKKSKVCPMVEWIYPDGLTRA